MADYDWTKGCGCPLMGQHYAGCEADPFYEQEKRKAEVVADRKAKGYELLQWPELWACITCGNVIWNPDMHSDFVKEYGAHPAKVTASVSPERCECGKLIFEDEPHTCLSA